MRIYSAGSFKLALVRSSTLYEAAVSSGPLRLIHDVSFRHPSVRSLFWPQPHLGRRATADTMESLCKDVNAVLRSLDVLAHRLTSEAQALSSHHIDGGVILHHIAELSQVIDQQFDAPSLQQRSRSSATSQSASDVQAELARLQNTLKYQRKARTKLQEKLDAEKTTKVGGRMRAIWLVRAGLSPPGVLQRTMADFLSQFPEELGAGADSGVSHCYVARARDAFAELLKELNGQELERLSATNVGATPFFIQHIHDEASMRLRSTPVVEDASFALPRSAAVGSALFTRSRYSKIQNSCITIGMGEQRLEWLSEMQALGRKDGDTLGLALIAAVQGIMKILAALPQRSVRVVHLLIGDGINTNEAAAKRLFEHYGRRAGGILQYRLISWRCASHQANLVVEVALCGKLLSRPLEENDLAANCSRFFKYLLAEHCDQFATALRRHIASTLQFNRYDSKAAAPPPSEAVLNMQRLYGNDVFPDSLVDIFPSDLSGWTCPCPDNAELASVRARVYQVLYRHVLQVEERPVVTRFWLFTNCVFCFLRMSVLRLPAGLFDLSCTSESSNRLKAFQKWWSDPLTDTYLRKAALCLRLTQFAVNLSARKRTSDAVPVLVRLAFGEVQRRTSLLLQDIVRLLHADPLLDVSATFLGLLKTQSHVIMRYEQYRQFPNKLCLMCKSYNSVGYQDAVKDFLDVDVSLLDYGYSLPLRQEATASGDRQRAIEYLTSDSVQRELQDIFKNSSAHDLDAERKHNVGKKGEARKLSSVSTASRNVLLRHYGRRRTAALRQMREGAARAKRKRFSNVWALAVQDNAAWLRRPRGQLRHETGVTAAQRREIVHEGDHDALHEYIAANLAELERRRDADHAEADLVLEPRMPYSTAEWIQFVEKNKAHVDALIKTASASRRSISHRLLATEALPQCPRIYPKPPSGPLPMWLRKIMNADAGVFAVKYGPRPDEKLVLYAATLRYQPWGCILEEKDDSEATYRLNMGVMLYGLLRPLKDQVSEMALPGDSEVFRMDAVDVSIAWPFAELALGGPVEVPAPVPQERARRPKGDSKVGCADEDDGAADALTDDAEVEGCATPSEWGSVVSDLESDVEAVAEEEEAAAGPEADPVLPEAPHVSDDEEADARMPPGTYTVAEYSNGYFTTTNHPKWPDVVITILPRWRKDHELGDVNYSFRCRPHHFGESAEAPKRAYMVLQSWMLWRAKTDGWHQRKACRFAWWQAAEDRLRREIVDLQVAGGGTGDAKADAKIRLFAPSVL